MEAVCPCHEGFEVGGDFYDHLVNRHGFEPPFAFALAALAVAGHEVAYSRTDEGLFLQLPLPNIAWDSAPLRGP